MSDPDSAIRGTVEGQLQGTEEPTGAWYGCGHKAQLSEDAVPFLGAHPALPVEVCKDLGQGQFTVWRELDCLPEGI